MRLVIINSKLKFYLSNKYKGTSTPWKATTQINNKSNRKIPKHQCNSHLNKRRSRKTKLNPTMIKALMKL